jgi:hypothetical protein
MGGASGGSWRPEGPTQRQLVAPRWLDFAAGLEVLAHDITTERMVELANDTPQRTRIPNLRIASGKRNTALRAIWANELCEQRASDDDGRGWLAARLTRLIDFYDMKIAARASRAASSSRLGVPTPISTARAYQLREGIMYHFATALIACIIAAVLSGIAFVPTPAEAAKLSDAEKVALQKATAACKEEAKGMKFKWHWRKRQKYVQNCMIRSANKQGIDIGEIRRAVNMKELPSEDIDDWSFVFSRPLR